MRAVPALGNLSPMNRWRVAGLIVLAMATAWLALRSFEPRKPAPATPPPPAPVRDQFHASKPLTVTATLASTSEPVELSWLERELRYMLMRGRMRVAAIGVTDGSPYDLRVEIEHALPSPAKLKLVGPAGKIEREQQVELDADELSIMRTLAQILPAFLGAAHSTEDWAAHVGTEDRSAYETFVRVSQQLLGPQGAGFTRPPAAADSETIDQLENLTRRHQRFARAWSLLAIAYLNLGGEDEASLTQLAESTAERSLTLNPASSDAQSALGLVQLRRGQWVAAMEHFNSALAVDPNATAALEGLACLLVDVGHASEALPFAQRATSLQPGSLGAAECLSYAQLATGADPAIDTSNAGARSLAAAQVRALDAILAGNLPAARETLMQADATRRSSTWIEPLLRAAADKKQTSQALQAITRAASDRSIDPVTELVCGTALRQTDFVFNRMLRLEKQNESVPLRLLWLPRTDFLRQSARFESVVSTAGLLPFWQDHGSPDICQSETDVYGCKIKPQRLKKDE